MRCITPSEHPGKKTTVYWVLADIPAKFRSKIHVIELAASVKPVHLTEFGFKIAMVTLWTDLAFLEKQADFIESLGENLKGTVVFV